MKTKNKAFTLVELLVVIAILAILATVCIIGYSSFTRKATESNDSALVTQLNVVLQANETTQKATTPSEALGQASDAGFDVTKLTPTTGGYNIVWNEDTNRFALLDDKGSAVSGEANATAYKNWKFTSDYAEGETSSVYLIDGYSGGTITAGAGVDVGNNQNVSINYSNKGAAQTVTFRMRGGTLMVDAPADTIYSYGEKDDVQLTAVATESYHEFGSVLGNITIASGKVEVENGATLGGIILVTGNKVQIDAKAKNIQVAVASDVTEQPNVSGAEQATSATIATTAEALQTAFETDGRVILGADLDLTTTLTVASGKNVILNLNGHKISGTTMIFNVIGNFTLEGNGEVTTDSVVGSAEGGTLVVNGGTYTSQKDVAFWSDGGGSVTFNSCNVTAQEFCADAQLKSSITINGGNFTSRDNAVVGTYGKAGYGGNTITINDGTFNGRIQTSGYIACGIYLANDDTLNVNGGTFNITNGTGILLRGGKTTIGEDVVINLLYDSTLKTLSGKVGDSKVSIDVGTAIVVDYKSNYPGMTDTFNLTNNSKYEFAEINKSAE